jgi:Putative peptidoglycan binding domain
VSQKGSLPAKPDGPTTLSEQAEPDTVCPAPRPSSCSCKQQPVALDRRLLVKAGSRKSHVTREQDSVGGNSPTLLTTGVLVQGFPRSPAGSDSSKEGVAAFVIKDEITKMQETLRTKGHYQGKVDGVFGLRTRASIRAYQKAENLPVTGQVDSRTADECRAR